MNVRSRSMSVRAIKTGAVEFLTKPFRDQDLLDAIRQAIEDDTRAQEERAALLKQEARVPGSLVLPKPYEPVVLGTLLVAAVRATTAAVPA